MRSFWWSSPGLFRLISLAHTCKQLKTGQAKHIVSIFPMEMVWAKNLLCSLFANRFCSRQMCWHIEVDGFLCAFQVFSTSWWMMAYGSPTPKRLIAMTNWMPAMKLDLGSLAREYMKEKTEFQTASFLASCCTWKSLCTLSFPILVIACICIIWGKKGKAWTGNKNLKLTQFLGHCILYKSHFSGFERVSLL